MLSREISIFAKDYVLSIDRFYSTGDVSVSRSSSIDIEFMFFFASEHLILDGWNATFVCLSICIVLKFTIFERSIFKGCEAVLLE